MRNPARLVVTACVIALSAVVVGATPAGQAGARLPAAVGPAPADPQAAPANNTASIFGQVVDGSTGRPVTDAVVTLNMRALAAQAGTATPAERAAGVVPPPSPPSVYTTGDGRFIFHDLPKGPAQLNVNAPGYVSGNVGQSRPNGPSRALEIGEGEHLTGVVIKLWKYAIVSGTITDEAGEPAVATTVQALRRVETAGRVQYQQASRAVTDDRGIYRLPQLVPGDYLVMLPFVQTTAPAGMTDAVIRSIVSGAPGGEALLDLMAAGATLGGQGGTRIDDVVYSADSTRGPAMRPDGRLSVYQTLFYPSAVSANGATPITVRSGEERAGVDMQLRLVPSARVSGVVTGPAGAMANVAVRLVPVAAEGASLYDQQVATATTRGDGSFTFIGVPAGQYLARVNKEPRPTLGGDAASNPMIQLAFGGAASTPPTGIAAMALYAAVPVTVTSADVTGLAIPLAPGAKLSGRVEFQGTANPPDLRGGPGAGQGGLNLSLTPMDTSSGGFMSAGTGNRFTETGTFSTRGYPPGRYALGVIGGTGPAWMLQSISIGGRDVLDSGFELRDADVADVVVTYTDKIAQVSGTARAAGGTAAPTATVVIVPSGYRPGLIASALSPRRARSLQAQKSGVFTLNAIGAGDYVVAAFNDADTGDLQDAAFIATVLRVGTHISIVEGEKKSLDLTIVRITR